jgi:hypothetical protein
MLSTLLSFFFKEIIFKCKIFQDGFCGTRPNACPWLERVQFHAGQGKEENAPVDPIFLSE